MSGSWTATVTAAPVPQLNMVPTTTGAAKAVALVYAGEGQITGFAMRSPPNVSAVI